MHGPRLHINRCLDVMAALQIGQEFIMQIAPAGPIPKVMMRVNNQLRGVQNLLTARGEPILTHGKVMLLLGHGVFLTAWL